MTAVGDALHDEPLLVVDGGLSTALEERGHTVGGLLWTARLVLEAPDEIVAAHRSFVDAGAEIVITAAYQASVEGFMRAGASPSAAAQALASTTELARRSGARFVAASIGPFGALLGDGSEYHGHYAAPWDDVRRVHRRRISVLADTGPDLYAVETVPTAAEAEIVLEELDRVGAAPSWLSVSRDDELPAVAALAEASSSVVAVGVNCMPVERATAALTELRTLTDLPLVAYPNHGRVWDAGNDCWIGDGTADVADHLVEWLALGVRLVGGCCGNGPADIERLVAAASALG